MGYQLEDKVADLVEENKALMLAEEYPAKKKDNKLPVLMGATSPPLAEVVMLTDKDLDNCVLRSTYL